MTMAVAALWKTAVILIAILHHSVPLVSAQLFLTEPRDAEILIDTPAIMRCRISEPSASVFWSVPGSSTTLAVRANRRFSADVPSKFSLQGEEGSEDFNLMISAVETEDVGQYICYVVLDGRGDIPSPTFESEPATLTVIQVPPTGNPVCWIREGRLAAVGDNLSLRCGSSDQSVGLTWYLGDLSLSHSSFDIAPHGVGIDSKFLAQASANQQKFTCQPNIGQYDICEVTIEVQHPPIVTIESEGLIETGQDARFTCMATGNPSNFAYTWHYSDFQVSFEEHPRFNQARLEQSGSVLVLPELTEYDNNVTLRCEAVNALGSATETHVIKAQPGKTLAQIIGPILLGIILGLVFIVLGLYAIWWRRQRRKVKQINKKKRKSIKRTFSRRERDEVVTIDSGIVYTQTVGGFGSRYGKKTSNGGPPRSGLDLESAGYGPDVTDIPAYRATAEEEQEDGALRPIPRKKSTSSMSSLANGGKQIATTSADDDALISPGNDKSFTYYVNPHFDERRNSGMKGDYENDLNPEEEKNVPPPYNIELDYPENKLTNNDYDDDNVISTEL